MIDDPAQVVLESEPYVRLSYTWPTFTPEVKELHDIPDDVFDRLLKEPRSKVTFEIEDLGEIVKLTVVHDGFEEGSAALTLVSEGWPKVLSGLKSLLETGEVLPERLNRCAGGEIRHTMGCRYSTGRLWSQAADQGLQSGYGIEPEGLERPER